MWFVGDKVEEDFFRQKRNRNMINLTPKSFFIIFISKIAPPHSIKVKLPLSLLLSWRPSKSSASSLVFSRCATPPPSTTSLNPWACRRASSPRTSSPTPSQPRASSKSTWTAPVSPDSTPWPYTRVSSALISPTAASPASKASHRKSSFSGSPSRT